MSPLHAKYRAVIELVEQGESDGYSEEREGRLFLVGTVRCHQDVARIWEAIRHVPDWDTEVVADIRSADGSAMVMTYAQPRPLVVRAAAGSSG